MHPAAKMLEDSSNRNAHVGVELIGQAGDEQGDLALHIA
jgi:hypothetical protein